jgi:hypothetical protein
MPGEAVLTGELGLLSLFDLGQLLMLNGATGEMTLTRDGRRGYLYFVRGQVVNAVDDEYHEGEGAAFQLFTWKSGTFEFRPGTPTDSRAISDSTEGLMMEAARRMDEAGSISGSKSGVADRLARRASSLEALRLAFDSVASEAKPVPEGAAADGSPFEQLRSPADALLLRPHDIPRVRLAGRWRNSGSQPLETGAFEQLRARLLETARGSDPGNGVRTWIATHDDDRHYEVTHLAGESEALWVRLAGLPPLTANQLDGPLDAWQTALGGTSGLLLVCAPEAEAADRLLHACVAQMLRQRAGTILVATEHSRWCHTDEQGALLHAPAATVVAAIGALAPDVAVFDHGHAAASAEALHAAARVVAAVVAPGPESALTRWCALVGRRWGDGIEALLASAPVDVVHARPDAGSAGRMAFGVRRLVLDPASPTCTQEVQAPEAAVVTVGPHHHTHAPAPESGTAADSAPAPAAPPADPMAALAAEITRTLSKAA